MESWATKQFVGRKQFSKTSCQETSCSITFAWRLCPPEKEDHRHSETWPGTAAKSQLCSPARAMCPLCKPSPPSPSRHPQGKGNRRWPRLPGLSQAALLELGARPCSSADLGHTPVCIPIVLPQGFTCPQQPLTRQPTHPRPQLAPKCKEACKPPVCTSRMQQERAGRRNGRGKS